MNSYSLAVIPAAVLMLAGCAPADPYTSAVDTCKTADAQSMESDSDSLMDSLYEGIFTVTDDMLLIEANETQLMMMGGSIRCVMTELGAPDSVWSRIAQTNGFSGAQTADWDGHEAVWSYSGSNGLRATVSRG